MQQSRGSLVGGCVLSKILIFLFLSPSFYNPGQKPKWNKQQQKKASCDNHLKKEAYY